MLSELFLDDAAVYPFYYFLHDTGMFACLLEVACKEVEWMNGSIITVFWLVH